MSKLYVWVTVSATAATLALGLSACSEYSEYDSSCVETAKDGYDDYSDAFYDYGNSPDMSEAEYVDMLCRND